MSGQIEFEAKVLGVDPEDIRGRLNRCGAEKVGNYYFKRYVFDTIPPDPNKWIRLRTDGSKTTLAVKEISADTIDGTRETEVEVSGFDTTLAILKLSGLCPHGYQENRREEYLLDDVLVSIDYWPRLDPYIEIEGRDELEVIRIAEKLGYLASDLTSVNTKNLYAEVGIDLQAIQHLSF